MSSTRVWVLGALVLSAALLVLGWVLGVSPRLAEIATVGEQTRSVQQQNKALEVTIERLRTDYRNLDAVAAQLAALRASLPASADYPGFLAELNAIAGRNSATLTAFTPGAPVVLGPQGAATPDAAPPPAEGTGSPAALADGTLVAIPVELSATGAFTDLLHLVGDLQSGRRLFLVGALAFSGTGSTYTANVTGYIYVGIDSSVAASAEAGTGPLPSGVTGIGAAPGKAG
jgi:Tfp pilus assembly protein PilO